MHRVRLSVAELEKLIAASTDDRYLDCSFGPGYVSVVMAPHNAWALDLLVEWRIGAALAEVVTAIDQVERTGLRLGCQRAGRGLIAST
jgi:hypothetical protein